MHSQSARDVYYRFTLHYKKENLVAERNLGDFFITFASSSPPLPITKTYVDSVLAYFTEQEPLMDPME